MTRATATGSRGLAALEEAAAGMMSDPDGNPATQTGHCADVWRKNAVGEWKVAVDAPLSDPPEDTE